MKKLYNLYCLAEEAVCALLFISIVVMVLSSALLRLVNHPLVWADDIARLMFPYAAFFGADIAMRRCRLVGVDIVVRKMRPRARKIVHIVMNLLIITLLCIFIHQGIILSARSWKRHFQTIPISYSLVTISLPIGSLCLILTAAIQIGKLIKHLNDDSYSLTDGVPGWKPSDSVGQAA